MLSFKKFGAEISLARVGEDRHYALAFAEELCHTKRNANIGAARDTAEDTFFLSEIQCGADGFIVRYDLDAGYYISVQDRRDKTVADTHLKM